MCCPSSVRSLGEGRGGEGGGGGEGRDVRRRSRVSLY